ncbi:uncharacterized protein [Triticum aestivum]|uniref:uncharacterized protein n=1 Tax=Triticum aestivum TaxID=4565 RepID=UPI001D030F51|nr:uncharacterized protein LOC123133875 [Triticum aestivum]
MPTFACTSFPVIMSSTLRAIKFDEKTAQGMSVRAKHISLSVRELVSSPMGSAAARRFTATTLVCSSLPIEVVRRCSVEVGQRRNDPKELLLSLVVAVGAAAC